MRGELWLLRRRGRPLPATLAPVAERPINRLIEPTRVGIVKRSLELFAERANLGRSASQPEHALRNAPASIAAPTEGEERQHRQRRLREVRRATPILVAVSSVSMAAVTRSATAEGVVASSLPSRCRNASP
jgi:hypothetical protein